MVEEKGNEETLKESCFFFSIIVPAHNEENYIESTLEHLFVLEYSKDLFEVIVIENGSTDATYEKARQYTTERNAQNCTVYKSEARGVSAARNHGLDLISSRADWIVFLDADTLLAPSFLQELNTFLRRSSMKSSVVGTTSILPTPSTMKALAWFMFYDLSHQLTRSSCSLFMVRKDALGVSRFNESQVLMEDLSFIRMMRRSGKFFFMHTKSVTTSTRRFEADGWVRLFLLYLGVGILPRTLQRRFGYDPVR